jgi:hypothetical protein
MAGMAFMKLCLQVSEPADEEVTQQRLTPAGSVPIVQVPRNSFAASSYFSPQVICGDRKSSVDRAWKLSITLQSDAESATLLLMFINVVPRLIAAMRAMFPPPVVQVTGSAHKSLANVDC